MSKPKIYLHWTAGWYDTLFEGKYHSIITGDGKVHKMVSYDKDSSHTWERNYNSIGLAVACMAGSKPWTECPPTDVQIESLCKETAEVMKYFGYTSNDVILENCMTHAEAAALMDFDKTLVINHGKYDDAHAKAYGMPHNNYGPTSWFNGWPGGTCERWDLWQLKPTDAGGVGGYLLRKKIKDYMIGVQKPQETPEEDRAKIKGYLRKYCQKYNISYLDILAQCIVESNLDPNAVSSSQALGVGQIKLGTAQDISKHFGFKVPEKKEDLLGIENAEFNCMLMCAYMSHLVEKASKYHYDMARLLYNSGEYALDVAKVSEQTPNYLNKITNKMNEIRKYVK